MVFLYSGKKLVSVLASFCFLIVYIMTVICFIVVLDIGTMVDSHVSQDTEFDLYMCSYAVIQDPCRLRVAQEIQV
jgi:hypothetical protein